MGAGAGGEGSGGALWKQHQIGSRCQLVARSPQRGSAYVAARYEEWGARGLGKGLAPCCALGTVLPTPAWSHISAVGRRKRIRVADFLSLSCSLPQAVGQGQTLP